MNQFLFFQKNRGNRFDIKPVSYFHKLFSECGFTDNNSLKTV